METEMVALPNVGDIVRSKSCGDIGIVHVVLDDDKEVMWLHQECSKKLVPDDVIIVDRNLFPGDIVVDSKNYHYGQAGIILDCSTSVDLLHPEGSIVEGVDSRELVHVLDFCIDDFVVLGPWIGRILHYIVDATVMFDNGSVCLVKEADSYLEPIGKLISNGNDYLPGSRVKVTNDPGVDLVNLGLTPGTEVIITKATINHVTVNWQLSAARDNGSPPCKSQSPYNIKKLPFFSHGVWQIFDWCYLSPTAQLSLLQENKGWTKPQLSDPLKPFFIVNTRTKVDVLWQDGTIGKHIDSTSLIHGNNSPALLFGELSIFPEQFVCKRIVTNNCCDLGIVRSVNIEDHTAQVKWLDQETENNEGLMEETVSVFEIEEHPECGYAIRDVVGWLPPVSSLSTHSDHPRLGMIIGLKNGDIDVSWLDGTVSRVGPQEIYWIPWKDMNVRPEEGEAIGTSWRKFRIFSALLVILACFSRVLCRMISLWHRRSMAPLTINTTDENKLQHQTHGNLNWFNSFDSAKNPSDHYFFATQGKEIIGRKWLRNVQEEWGVLENSLPDGIYVRAYEDRMDLLRAAIIGPCGTPYQDGLFIFDIQLPAEYPNVPPKVHYHSGGWRLNPNLNEDGTTCLSLLNTFEGKGTESWVSSSSNILQVLVSIQGLVLNSKPFFNESGYENLMGSVDGERSSLDYNENAFIVNCKTMMYLIRRPLKDFEELIRGHFARRGCYILKACSNYRNGHLVGSLSKDADPMMKISDDNHTANSKGFTLILDKIIRELFLAFNEVGADCSEFKTLYNDQDLIDPLKDLRSQF